MKSPWQGTMIGIWYDNHPHWVVDHGCYCVTLRCKGSLPSTIRAQLSEIGETLAQTRLADAEAESLRRQHFAILDRTLDAGKGPLPFTGKTATYLHQWIADYSVDGLAFDHWVIMPNHWHLITKPITFDTLEASKATWRRFKARSARYVNQIMQTTGPFWQNSLYDRWIRDEAEYERWINYLRNNPVKARLATRPEDFPHLR
jgi:REP element-mobilizing transposase RayT